MTLYLKKEPFDCIINKTKTIEVRKFNSKYNFKINDNIIFKNKNDIIKVKVIHLDIYENFSFMIDKLDYTKVRDNISKIEYIDILKNCYKNFDGKWIVIEFN